MIPAIVTLIVGVGFIVGKSCKSLLYCVANWKKH